MVSRPTGLQQNTSKPKVLIYLILFGFYSTPFCLRTAPLSSCSANASCTKVCAVSPIPCKPKNSNLKIQNVLLLINRAVIGQFNFTGESQEMGQFQSQDENWMKINKFTK